MRKYLFIFLFFLFTFQLTAATLRCSICRKKIRGKYFKSKGKTFCSQKCFDKIKPICAACGKRCLTGSFKKKDKFYCSKKCVETTLPKCVLCNKPFHQGVVIKVPAGDKVYCKSCGSLPKCFACSLPVASGTHLKDGRFLGAKCAKTAIFSEAEGKKLFDKIRAKVRSKLGWATNHTIRFRLVDAKTLRKASANYEPGMEMGLFKHNYTINTKTETKYSLLKGREDKTTKKRTNERYTIFILSALPKRKFIEVCAHELGHDWMQGNFPKIKDLKIKEGWAEYFATRINDIYGQEYMNKRMNANSNAVYGGGYRFIRDYVKQHGIKGLFKYFRHLNR
ncbi:MAG: hypothetical protein KOO69_07685 [Victivallales bacterium]|nr:hypothetical protein [Victivallales bacterium]